MKRLRTLSVQNPAALDRFIHRSAWGQGHWRRTNTRKMLEKQTRQMKRILLSVVPVPMPADELPGEAPLQSAAPAVH